MDSLAVVTPVCFPFEPISPMISQPFGPGLGDPGCLRGQAPLVASDPPSADYQSFIR